MKLTKSIKFKHALLISQEDLRRFDEYVANEIGAITYEVTCNDGAEFSPSNLDELLSYENPSFRRIDAIAMRATGPRGFISIELRGGGDFFEASRVRMEFNDHSKQKPVEDEIRKRIATFRPWYSFLTRISFAFSIPMALVALMFSYWSISGLKKLFSGARDPIKEVSSPYTTNEATTILLLFFLVVMAAGAILDKFRGYLFPSMAVLIGRGLDDHKRRQSILNIVFVVIGLGVVSNILAAIIWK